MDFDNIIPSLQKLPIYTATIWLLICLGIFSILQEFFPFDKSQPKVRKDAWVDVVYWISAPLIYASISLGLVYVGLMAIFGGNETAVIAFAKSGAAWATTMPIWLQAILVLIIQDFSLYWTHRLFHQGKLWNYHAVHHGAQNMDWLHSVRFHPLNVVFHSVFANALVLWIGFSPLTIAALLPFNTLYSAMVHANLNWTFGPYLRYVFASPVFHRWHHTGPDEGGNLNFAATFPILDVIFGTYYMPEDKVPGPTGIYEDYVPKDIIGQMVFPFMPRKS